MAVSAPGTLITHVLPLWYEYVKACDELDLSDAVTKDSFLETIRDEGRCLRCYEQGHFRSSPHCIFHASRGRYVFGRVLEDTPYAIYVAMLRQWTRTEESYRHVLQKACSLPVSQACNALLPTLCVRCLDMKLAEHLFECRISGSDERKLVRSISIRSLLAGSTSCMLCTFLFDRVYQRLEDGVIQGRKHIGFPTAALQPAFDVQLGVYIEQNFLEFDTLRHPYWAGCSFIFDAFELFAGMA